MISDFGVFISICSMTGLDYFAGVHTPKLHVKLLVNKIFKKSFRVYVLPQQVPSDFKPTWEGRGWIINPFHPNNPWWIIPGTMLPAALATILLFLDQQITAVIVNRRENKLRVSYYDLFISNNI